MYSCFISLFCSVYIVCCTVSYLLYLFVCVYLLDAIEGEPFEDPFEDPQDQSFEDAGQQQCFEKGKCS